LLLAPAAALISTLMAALVGGFAGYLGGGWARIAMAVMYFFLSLPGLFLLITVRAYAAERVSAGLCAGNVLDAGHAGMDERSARIVRDFSVVAGVGFFAAGSGFRNSGVPLVPCARAAELDARALRSVLDFDS